MKTKIGIVSGVKGFANALACAAVFHTARAEAFVVEVNPANGFGGRTNLWNVEHAGALYS
jgi:hypothetical protein